MVQLDIQNDTKYFRTFVGAQGRNVKNVAAQ